MSKYRPYLTKDETARLDAIISAQNEHRQRLRELRKPYLDLIWKGRDRARSALSTTEPVELQTDREKGA